MAKTISDDDLQALYAKGAPVRNREAPASQPAAPPAAPAADLTQLTSLLDRVAAMHSSQLDKLSAVLQAMANRPQPAATTTTVEVPTPRPCTLKVKRDSKGFIDSIDVLPQE